MVGITAYGAYVPMLRLPLAAIGRLANAAGALGATRKGPMEGAFLREDVEAFMQGRTL